MIRSDRFRHEHGGDPLFPPLPPLLPPAAGGRGPTVAAGSSPPGGGLAGRRLLLEQPNDVPSSNNRPPHAVLTATEAFSGRHELPVGPHHRCLGPGCLP